MSTTTTGGNYDYLSERYRLSRVLQLPVHLCIDPLHWGAKVIQYKLADNELVVTVTDAQIRDVGSGDLVRCLSGWPVEKRRSFDDLHWCVVIHWPGGPLLVRQQAPDTEFDSLVSALKLAMSYALESMETGAAL